MSACIYSKNCTAAVWHEGLCRDHARAAYAGVSTGYHTVANKGACLAPGCPTRLTTGLYYCPAHTDKLPFSREDCRHPRTSQSSVQGCCEYHKRYRRWCESAEAERTKLLTDAMSAYRALFAAAGKEFRAPAAKSERAAESTRKRKAPARGPSDDAPPSPKRRKEAPGPSDDSSEADPPHEEGAPRADHASNAELLRQLYHLAAELSGRGLVVFVSTAPPQ